MNLYRIEFVNDNITPHLVEKWKGKLTTLQQLEPHLKELGKVIINIEEYKIIVYNDYIE